MADETLKFIKLGFHSVDLNSRWVRSEEHKTRLTESEVDFLRYLAERPNQIVTRNELLVGVLGYSPKVNTRAVDHLVKRLRPKIEADARHPEFLMTVRGVGYRLILPETGHKTNLKPDHSRFVGRDKELMELRRLLPVERFLTLVGPPGTGKTRLATQVALGLDERFPGGRWFCDLKTAQSRLGLFECLMAGVPVLRLAAQASEEELPDAMAGAFESQAMQLVILDNAEHITGILGELLAHWMENTSKVCVVVTSRRPLVIAGEQLVRIKPLTTSEAQVLLLDRVRALRPDFEIKQANQALLPKLVDALDRLPLAIELAATRLSTLSLQELLARTTASLPTVGAGEGALQRAIALSWDLLEPDEQAMLAQLSVFSGGCTLQALEAVVLLEDHEAGATLNTLQSLLLHSLVTISETSGSMRFSLLESILEFARQRCTENYGDATELRRRHATFFAQAGWSPIRAKRVKLVRADFDNLYTTMEYALQHNLGDQATSACMGMMDLNLQLIGSVDGFNVLFGQSVEMAQRCLAANPGVELRVAVLGRMGNAQRTMGDVDGAHASLTEALQLAGSLEGRAHEGVVLGRLASVYRVQGRYDEARAHYEQALVIHRSVDNLAYQCLEFTNIGIIYRLQGQYTEAEKCFFEALAVQERSGSEGIQGVILGNLGALYLDMDRKEHARPHFDQALEIFRKVDDLSSQAIALDFIAEFQVASGDIEAARATLGQVIELCEQLHVPLAKGVALGILGEIAGQDGDGVAARAMFTEGEALLRRAGLWSETISLLCRKSNTLAHLGDKVGAKEAFATAQELASQHSFPADSSLGRQLQALKERY